MYTSSHNMYKSNHELLENIIREIIIRHADITV